MNYKFNIFLALFMLTLSNSPILPMRKDKKGKDKNIYDPLQIRGSVITTTTQTQMPPEEGDPFDLDASEKAAQRAQREKEKFWNTLSPLPFQPLQKTSPSQVSPSAALSSNNNDGGVGSSNEPQPVATPKSAPTASEPEVIQIKTDRNPVTVATDRLNKYFSNLSEYRNAMSRIEEVITQLDNIQKELTLKKAQWQERQSIQKSTTASPEEKKGALRELPSITNHINSLSTQQEALNTELMHLRDVTQNKTTDSPSQIFEYIFVANQSLDLALLDLTRVFKHTNLWEEILKNNITFESLIDPKSHFYDTLKKSIEKTASNTNVFSNQIPYFFIYKLLSIAASEEPQVFLDGLTFLKNYSQKNEHIPEIFFTLEALAVTLGRKSAQIRTIRPLVTTTLKTLGEISAKNPDVPFLPVLLAQETKSSANADGWKTNPPFYALAFFRPQKDARLSHEEQNLAALQENILANAHIPYDNPVPLAHHPVPRKLLTAPPS